MDISCYLCHRESQLLFTKSGYRLFRCPSCGLVQTDLGKPYDVFLQEFYTDGYFLGDVKKSAYKDYQKDKPYILKNMKTFLSLLQRQKQKGTLLDVGCAYGFFVELALQHGFDAYGVDPSKHAVGQAASHVSPRLKEGTTAAISYAPQSFDVISMLDVFEHLADPVAELTRLRPWLKDDGILFLATGDTGSLAAKILKRRWTFYIPPQHLLFFNRQTITETLGQAGFVPISFSRVGKWLSLSYVLHLARTTGESSIANFLQPMVDVLHLGSLPLYIPMGDNMVVMAKKLDL